MKSECKRQNFQTYVTDQNNEYAIRFCMNPEIWCEFPFRLIGIEHIKEIPSYCLW